MIQRDPTRENGDSAEVKNVMFTAVNQQRGGEYDRYADRTSKNEGGFSAESDQQTLPVYEEG